MPQLNSLQFPEPGLYLIWPDGSRLDLTRERIEAVARAMLDDPTRIPPQMKAAADYKACDICPQRHTAEICHSIMAALPFMDEIDRYMSFDQVTAVFRDSNSDILHVVETTMQEALKYVSLLGLTQYCELGRQYGAYFQGTIPLMPPPTLAAALYRNIYFAKLGNMREIETTIRTMQRELLHTTHCQVARLQLVSRRDAFVNAFVATYTTIEYLFVELGKHLNQTNVAPALLHGP